MGGGEIMTKYVIYGIDYDTDDASDLPTTIDCTTDIVDADELQEHLSDYISNETGFCHKGFEYRVES